MYGLILATLCAVSYDGKQGGKKNYHPYSRAMYHYAPIPYGDYRSRIEIPEKADILDICYTSGAPRD